MKTVKLYGALGKRFGKLHRLEVANTLDAVRALCALHRGFKPMFARGQYRVVLDNAPVQTGEELQLPAREIRIIPVTQGAGHGLGQVFLGVALIVASFYVPGLAIGLGASATTAGMLGSMVFSFGMTLTMGGIAQLLAKTPNTQPDYSNSYTLHGPMNSTQEGNPVPIIYGRLMVGSQVISASLQSYDIPIGALTTNSGNSTVTSSNGTTLGTINQSTYLGGT